MEICVQDMREYIIIAIIVVLSRELLFPNQRIDARLRQSFRMKSR